MEPVGAHLNHCKEVPILCLKQMPCEFETFGSHLKELLLQLGAPIRSEVWDIYHVIACNLCDLPRQSSWESPLRIAVRREEAGDHPPRERLGGIGERYAQNDRFFFGVS